METSPPLGVEAVVKEIKEKGLEEEVRRETGDKFFLLYGTKSKSTYELKLDNHEVKIKVESPIASDEDDEDSQDARNAEITLDAVKCSEIDLYFKKKFGPEEDPTETEREKIVSIIEKLAGKRGKSPKEEKKLKEAHSKLKKFDRDAAKEAKAAAAAGGTKKT